MKRQKVRIAENVINIGRLLLFIISLRTECRSVSLIRRSIIVLQMFTPIAGALNAYKLVIQMLTFKLLRFWFDVYE